MGERGLSDAARDLLLRICDDAGIPLPPAVEGADIGFRLRARLAIRGRATSPKIGIFQEGSHRIADIPSCLVHHPRINAVVDAVKTAIRRTATLPYADAAHRGDLRYLQAVVERRSGTVQLVLVGNATSPDALAPLADVLHREHPSLLHSLWWNGQPDRSNTILGPHWHRWAGADAVEETIGGAAVFFPPDAFGQSNLDVADHMVEVVHGWVPDGARVAEFYAGCGAIGLGLAERTRQIVLNEVSPGGVSGLRRGIAALPPGTRDRTTVLVGPATTHAGALRDADIVIADPPRKGCDAVVLDTLVAAPPQRCILVSCDLGAFARDASRLTGSGAFALRALVPFVLVPYTDHVETVALFERRAT